MQCLKLVKCQKLCAYTDTKELCIVCFGFNVAIAVAVFISVCMYNVHTYVVLYQKFYLCFPFEPLFNVIGIVVIVWHHCDAKNENNNNRPKH